MEDVKGHLHPTRSLRTSSLSGVPALSQGQREQLERRFNRRVGQQLAGFQTRRKAWRRLEDQLFLALQGHINQQREYRYAAAGA